MKKDEQERVHADGRTVNTGATQRTSKKRGKSIRKYRYIGIVSIAR